MKTYQIKFNDFGEVYVVAGDFSEAETKFMRSLYGGDDVEIKSIIHVHETKEPLI